MTTEQEAPKRNNRYQVISVEKSDAPEGMAGNNWHRYVIGQGDSRIEGLRSGTLKSVTAHAQTCAEELNNRGVRGYSAYAPRKQKPVSR
jgi:hypothetical protein